MIDITTDPIPIRQNVGQSCLSVCDKDGPCFWCGLEGMCCKRGRIVNGCDGKIGGVDEHECAKEAPGGKMFMPSFYNSLYLITISNRK